ncbi:MAG: HdeD family acid-resistance protein [Chloroflexi bacterium]|nr:HdeD family acid-resistance protein [Chloroflexota bacterium]
MYQALVRNTRLLALRGVAAVAFGVIALAWPNLTFAALLALFGAFALLEGALTLGAGLTLAAHRSTDWVPYLLGGLAGIAVGAVTFLYPGITALTLVYLIAFWAIVAGVFEFAAAIELAGELQRDWALGLAGVLSVAFGILVALDPRSGALSVIWLIGLYAILAGLTRLVLAYRLNKGESQLRSAFQPSAGRS